MAAILTAPCELNSEAIKSSLSAAIAAERILIRPIDLIAFASDLLMIRFCQMQFLGRPGEI